MAYFSRDNAEVFYELSGSEGPWITLVNGHTRASSDFRSLINHLLKQGIRVATLDNRGSGKTKTSAPIEFRQLLEDIEELWKIAGISKTALLGISMGGVICQNLAQKKPQIVERLILVSTTAREDWFIDHEIGWGSSLESVKIKLRTFFGKQFLAKNKLLVDSMAKQIFQGVSQGSFSESSSSQLKAMRGHYDTTTILNEILCPVLVIHGDDDQIISVKAAEELVQNLPKARLAVYTEKGHLLLAEAAPQLFADTVGFLRES